MRGTTPNICPNRQRALVTLFLASVNIKVIMKVVRKFK